MKPIETTRRSFLSFLGLAPAMPVVPPVAPQPAPAPLDLPLVGEVDNHWGEKINRALLELDARTRQGPRGQA